MLKKIKRIFVICGFVVLSTYIVNAQEKSVGFPLNIGYYGVYGIQMGMKLGGEWKLRNLITSKENYFLISPQIGGFVRARNHKSLVLNSDIGYRIVGRKNRHITPSFGLGYLLSNQVLSSTIDLSSGDISDSNREWRHYFLPTVNLAFGKPPIGRKWGWFSKLSYGRKISTKIENAGFFAIEIGVQLKIRAK